MNFVISRLLEGSNFSFTDYKGVTSFLSLFLFLLTLFSMGTKGLILGIDFTGGIVLEVRSDRNIDIDQLRSDFGKNPDLPTASIQYVENHEQVVIRMRSQALYETLTQVKHFLKTYNFRYDKIDVIGPQIGKSLIYKSGIAIVLSIIAIFIYLLFRFSLSFALSGLLTILHDIVLLICIYSVFGLEFNTSSVAAILTIVGYSINDSVVIFDKLRENSGIQNVTKRINMSVNATLSRTILTSATTMLAMLPVALLSHGDMRVFSLIILAGITIGTYSSIFISAPLALARHTSEKDST